MTKKGERNLWLENLFFPPHGGSWLLRFELFGLYFSFLATLLSWIGSDPSFGAYLRGAWFSRGKKEGKPSSLRVFLCSSSAICVAFLRRFLHFLLCLSRDRVSVWCVPSVSLILASEIPVCRRDHGNFFSYLRLDVLLRHLISVLFTALFTFVPWLFRL
jgi:hypothetical protein